MVKSIDYKAELNEELLVEGQEIVQLLNQNYRDIFDVVDRMKTFAQKVKDNSEQGDLILDSFKKKAEFKVPTNTRNFVFSLAAQTEDFDSVQFERFVDQVCDWKLPTSTVNKITTIGDRKVLEEILEQEKAPSGEQLKSLLPKKPIKSIAPNRKFTAEHLELACQKLGLEDIGIRSNFEGRIIRLAAEKEEDISTNHLIEVLAKATKTAIATTQNDLNIDKRKVLKLFTAPGKIAYQYKLDAIELEIQNNKLTQEQERLSLENRQTNLQLNQLQEQMNNILQQIPQLQSSGLHIAPAA